ncbi:MAG: UDP-N-acetylmuramate dehydrogenase [Clostridiaceae bacterium]|nr:UDP-N-acetylmuramate dehydrogenase [Clostridiaceae bacterium]
MVSILGEDSVARNVSMKEYTSIRTGGEARYLAEPATTEEVIKILQYLRENRQNFYVMGNGTNLVFPDSGYDGVVIRIGSKLSRIGHEGNRIMAQAGASLAAVSNMALDAGLKGFEFASGIPGTIGGAVAMNAGAYDGEMSHVVAETLCVDDKGRLIRLKGKEHAFGYRKSRIQTDGLVVLEVTLELTPGDKSCIKRRMEDFNGRRREKQPLNMPSAGSVFKRPEGYYAGQLIQECGLKGYTIGGAQVSDKHCGFIVNLGNATSQDVLDLIRYVRKTVYEKTGILLEPEVRIIGGEL